MSLVCVGVSSIRVSSMGLDWHGSSAWAKQPNTKHRSKRELHGLYDVDVVGERKS